MAAIPLRSHAFTALVAMSIFWCGAIAGMLILHSTSATEPTTSAPEPAAAPKPTAARTTTVRVVTVRSALLAEKNDASALTTFEDRWSARDADHAAPIDHAPPSPIADSRAQLATGETKPAAPEQPQDKVCGGRGRDYFYIGHHKYWHCRRR
jgi:hypothetical protein